MNKYLVAIIAIIFVGGFVFHIYTEQKMQQYELHEHCGQLAKTYFKKNFDDDVNGGFADTEDGWTITNFQNHYNPTLNKCFFIGKRYDFIRHTLTGSLNISLVDLNENREFGRFILSNPVNNKSPSACNVAGKTCHSEADWKDLIKPYMEDTE